MANEVVTIRGVRCIVLTCGTCGVLHAFPEAKYDAAFLEGGFWDCPNGHSRGWREGKQKRDQDDLRLERDRLKQSLAQKDDEIREARARADRETARADAEAKKAARVTKRAVAALCPCCNRSFSQLARHMKTKHPNVVQIPQRAQEKANG